MAGDLNFKVNFDTQQAGSEILALLNKFAAGSEAAGDKLNRALGGTTERKLVIRTERDDRGIKQVKSELLNIRSEADKLKKSLTNVFKTEPGSLTNVRQELRKALQDRDSIRKFANEITVLNGKRFVTPQQTKDWIIANEKVNALRQSLNLLENADKPFGAQITSGFENFLKKGEEITKLVTIFQSIGIAIATVVAPTKAAIKALAELDSFALSFKAIGVGAGQAQAALNESSRIALGLGVNIQTVRDSFQQLSPVILNSGGSLDDVGKITESLSSRFAAFGLNADKSRRVLNGVIQAFAKGKLQAEELTQQISEADPAFKTDFANALFKSSDALKLLGGESEALGKRLDRLTASGNKPVTALEGLVKSGKITAEVLKLVIPQLSKSEILFGKLGPTATSAFQALKAGDVTVNQFTANLESLNQLNLERLANIFKPVLLSFLEATAGLTDFAIAISKLQITKDIASILVNIGNSFANLTKIALAGAEGILRIIGVFTPLIDLLTKIPGLLEIIGVALIAKFIKPFKDQLGNVIVNKFIDPVKNAIGPVKELEAALLKLSEASQSNFSIVDVNKGAIPDEKPVKKEKIDNSAAIASAKKLRQEWGITYNAIEDGATDAANAISRELGRRRFDIDPSNIQIGEGADIPTVDINARANIDIEAAAAEFAGIIQNSEEYNTLLEQRQTLVDRLAANQQRQAANAETLVRLERERTARQGQADNPALSRAERAQASADASDLGRQIANVGRSQRLLVRYANEYETALAPIQRRYEILQSQIDGSVVRAQRLARAQQQNIAAEAAAAPRNAIRAREREATEVVKLTKLVKQYNNESVARYANALNGEDQYINRLKAGNADIAARIDQLKALLDAIREGAQGQPFFQAGSPDISQIRTEFEELSARFDKNAIEISVLEGKNADLARSYLEVGDALVDLGSKSNIKIGQGLNKLRTTAVILNNAYDDASASVTRLTNKEAALAYQQKVLQSALRGTPVGPAYDKLQDKLQAVNSELKATRDELKLNQKAAANLKDNLEGTLDAIDIGTKAQKGLSGLRNSFNDLERAGGETPNLLNKIQRAAGRLGNATLSLGASIKGVIGNVLGLIKSIGPELAVFGVLALLTASYAKATEATRKAQEKAADSINEITTTIKDLDKSVDEFGTSAPSVFDELQKKVDPATASLLLIGNVLVSIRDAFKKLIETIAGVTVDPVTNQITKLGNAFTRTLGIIGTIAGGALTGFLVSGLNPVGALIGGAVAGLGVLIVQVGSSKAAFEQLKTKLEASRQTYEQQAVSLIALADSLDKVAKKIADVEKAGKGNKDPLQFDSQKAALTGKAAAGLSQLISGYQNLQEELKATQFEIVNTDKRQAQITQKRKQAEAVINDPFSDPKALDDAKKAVEELSAQENINKDVKAELLKTEAQLIARQKELENRIKALKEKFPQLTDEVLNSKNTTDKLSKAYQDNAEALKLIDPKLLPEEFDNLAKEMGKTKAEMEAIDDRAKSGELAGYITRLIQQFKKKEIPTSLNNINKLVSALEERSLLLDIKSPELPKVLQMLQIARQKAEELDATKAEIEIKVTTKALTSGQLKSTQAVLGRLIQNYEKLANTAVIGSEQFEQVKTFKAGLQDLAAFVAKTKLQIDEENRNLQKTIRDNEIKLNIAPGPLRDALATANQANTEVVNAANKYAQVIRDTEAQKKAGIINQDTASARLKQAGLDYKNAITSAAASIRDQIRSLKEAVATAKSSRQSLILSKPEFFTAKEIEANAESINQRVQKYLDKQQPGLTVTFTGTPEEILQQKLDFVETREQADKLEKTITESRQAITALEAAFQKLTEGAGSLAKIDLAVPAANTENLANSLAYGSLKAQEISDTLNNIPREITINVKYTGNPPRFSGGPVSAGQAYTVNELGQEGFLSNSGRITAINKPRNGTWRPASSGTVIPAHIWKQMKSSGATNVSMPKGNYSRQNGMDLMVSAFGSFMSAHSAVTSSNSNENARVQAHQALQIAKLAKAVDDLAKKDWNVDVKVRNTGNMAYLDALTRSM